MNRGRGGNHGRGGGGGGRQYTPRGRSSRSADQYVRREPVDSGARSADAPSGSRPLEVGRNLETAPIDGVTKKFDGLLSSDFPEPRGVGNLSPNDLNFKWVQSLPEVEPTTPLNLLPVAPSYKSTSSEMTSMTPKIIESYFSPMLLVDAIHNKNEPSQIIAAQFHQKVQSGKTESEGSSANNELEKSVSQNIGFSFDICEEINNKLVKLNPPLLTKNKAMRNEKKRRDQGDNIQVLRPGMILLKSYISLINQVKLIKSCRALGRGPGGFYQPGYRDGARLHLKMMCLGKNWDPETSSYGDIRPVDQAKPPPIPNVFEKLVKEAILECHGYLESESKVRNAKNIIPSMSPNICIINFYTKKGILGLHQDKDESQESLIKGLPVVSISLGDSAEFLFGDQRDLDKANKVKLESGDVLIFGGESRHIFHGVGSIYPDTAPKALLEDTGLRPGRLNLTFREY